MKGKKKILSVLLALVLLLGMVPFSRAAYADEGSNEIYPDEQAQDATSTEQEPVGEDWNTDEPEESPERPESENIESEVLDEPPAETAAQISEQSDPEADYSEESAAEGTEEPVSAPSWALSFPISHSIAYMSPRTEIGTIEIKDAQHYADGQAIRVTLKYSSFSSDRHSIPVRITVIQNGKESVWENGASFSLKPDGSDPLTIVLYIEEADWLAAPSGAYTLSLNYHSALAGE